MTGCVVSADSSLAQLVQAALKTDRIRLFSSSDTTIAALIVPNQPPIECLIIDLMTIPDGGRLVDFVRFSCVLREILVITVGEEENYAALDAFTLDGINGIVYSPASETDIATVVAALHVTQPSSTEQQSEIN